MNTLLPEVELPETRAALCEAVLALLDEWDLHEVNQAELLGLPSLDKLRRTGTLPKNEEVLERAGHLLALGRALRLAFPYKPTARRQWVVTPHRILNGAMPLQIMLEGGCEAIEEVRHLAEVSP